MRMTAGEQRWANIELDVIKHQIETTVDHE
jgi:hypothetical protein